MGLPTAAKPADKKKVPRDSKTMWDYLVYALLGLATIGSVLYVTLSPETEDPPEPKRPDIEQ
jgi:hypothetical protein